jgi:hypothetical protein
VQKEERKSERERESRKVRDGDMKTSSWQYGNGLFSHLNKYEDESSGGGAAEGAAEDSSDSSVAE